MSVSLTDENRVILMVSHNLLNILCSGIDTFSHVNKENDNFLSFGMDYIPRKRSICLPMSVTIHVKIGG